MHKEKVEKIDGEKVWTVTMRVVATDSETASSIETLIENALDADHILRNNLDVHLVRAREGEA